LLYYNLPIFTATLFIEKATWYLILCNPIVDFYPLQLNYREQATYTKYV
jgi:hypothetical protein